ncbi:hypothetical protein [Candidatus Methylacidiphilum infernorum]|uniref:Uncharacterized protein n=1 Tax=Methylacidiphilum infernorum (isolate V4) TaxID=481448 RepID=B3DWP4_METI4|nr:hypothetical protein [Candidatus Methylacidiphilum infernorum]ACD83707.1 Hypothetical protein Minf_1653 [Methylacidiphilum infernorum V4]
MPTKKSFWDVKTILLVSLIILGTFAVETKTALAIRAKWEPFEQPVAGQEGSGAHTVVKGMKVYTTPPARPYIIFGFITAANGLFGFPITRAVTIAKKVGADALLLLDKEKSVVGASGNWVGNNQQQALGNGSGSTGYNYSWGNSSLYYAVIDKYAAIRWVDPSRTSVPDEAFNNRDSSHVKRAIPVQSELH